MEKIFVTASSNKIDTVVAELRDADTILFDSGASGIEYVFGNIPYE